jgi:hypothetical protein
MSAIDLLSNSAELRRTADIARWMSALRLIGAGLVALGVVFEFVGELAGRQSERQIQAAHEVQIQQLAERMISLRRSTIINDQASSCIQNSSSSSFHYNDRLGKSSPCPRAR